MHVRFEEMAQSAPFQPTENLLKKTRDFVNSSKNGRAFYLRCVRHPPYPDRAAGFGVFFIFLPFLPPIINSLFH